MRESTAEGEYVTIRDVSHRRIVGSIVRASQTTYDEWQESLYKHSAFFGAGGSQVGACQWAICQVGCMDECFRFLIAFHCSSSSA